MSNTKKLLDNLSKITQKPKSRFEKERIQHITNRFYIPNSQHTLPKSYDNAKVYTDNDWLEDGKYIMIDRIYGGLHKSDQRLTQKDGTTYKGKLYHKRRLVAHKNQLGEKENFYSRCTVTADGRWFDNGGFPIEVPTKLEPEKVKTAEEQEEEERNKTERTKAKEAAILANRK